MQPTENEGQLPNDLGEVETPEGIPEVVVPHPESERVEDQSPVDMGVEGDK